ncbi:hypothetical protein Afil01_57040 [Actinorhabdospora filicis]|uniref:Ig-like domain-containing protein n=1 Tax=Actinorhabdospora filicis TaxID=1785913 RepID=A0A9W6SS95_9ACTN|nr:hypothetical protein [Actinorhabdospora filicis]GLZ80897.1 hypothetical protein Afil01_57040 [Actinorhabdospora filicis]
MRRRLIIPLLAAALVPVIVPATPAAAEPPSARPLPAAAPDPLSPSDPMDGFGLGDQPMPAPPPTLAAAEGVPVTVTARDRHGKAPDLADVFCMDPADGTWAPARLTGGEGAMDLPPGEYGCLIRMLTKATDSRRGEYAATWRFLTVGASGGSLAFDGAGLSPLKVVTPRASVTQVAYTALRFGAGENFIAASAAMDETTDLYIRPSADRRFAHTFRVAAAAPGGGDYSYHLLFKERTGVPRDLVYEVRPRDLAVGTVRYGGLGAATPAKQCATSNDDDLLEGMCLLLDITVPSTRTEYYQVGVLYQPSLFLVDEQRGLVALHHGERVMRPGRFREDFVPGALGFGAYGFRWHDSVSFDSSLAELTFFDEGFLTGTAVLSKDGAELMRAEGDVTSFYADLPPGDTGRYRLAVDGRLGASWTSLGAKISGVWEFASAGGTGTLPLLMPHWTVSGVADGAAKAGRDQRVTVTSPASEGIPAATSLTLEASYDDGATWTPVSLVNGRGVLRHPRGAASVSLRATAADADGNTATVSVVRSYLLR